MTKIIVSDDLLDLKIDESAVTAGVFDGVHIGHRQVISTLLEEAKKLSSGRSVLLTFDPHPLSVTHPERSPELLTTIDEKISLLKESGVDIIVVERFDKRLSALDYREFISKRLISNLGMRHMVVGYDFHLGRDREGDHLHLTEAGRKYGFGVTVVPPVVVDGIAVSSTRIRQNVRDRKLDESARLLTRRYFLDADVVHGSGVGTEMDFPTANAELAHGEKLVPPTGVYAVRVEAQGRTYDGMMNIGSAPTVHHGGSRRIEVHLFDFSGDLYGVRLRIGLVEFLREEKVFAGREELKSQLDRDREKVRRILEKSIDIQDQ